MEKLLAIVILFICQNVFCQEYEFDTSIQYREKTMMFDNESYLTIFFNSKNTSYYFITRTWNKEVNCFLIDNNLNLSHEYIINNINNDTDFEYLLSKKIYPDSCNVDCSLFEINESNNSKGNALIIGSFYKNKKRKQKSRCRIEIECKPFNFSILNQLIKILQHHFYFCYDIKTSQNSIPFSIKTFDGKQCTVDTQLIKKLNVDFKFSVDKNKLKYTINTN